MTDLSGIAMDTPILICNALPFSLVTRKAEISPVSIEKTVELMKRYGFESAWGHQNTLYRVNTLLHMDITPAVRRPLVCLDEDGLPLLNGISFHRIIVISPVYARHCRPKIGEEVRESDIKDWHLVLIQFL